MTRDESGNERQPWTTLSSEMKYDNPWITVTEHQVLNAAQSPGIYGTVHFKNLAIGIVPVDRNGFTWLVGQFRYPLEKYSWEIPEGGGKLNAPPLETAKRELKEETGLEAAHWQLILEMHLSNSVTDERGLVYLATDLTEGNAEPDEDEVLTLRRVSLQNAIQMVDRGEITDSISVAALLKVGRLFNI
jgi:8-oxo-dGTP pyrophosphatase MutT (NUDIX family)